MDPRERLGEFQEAVLAALDGRQVLIHTTMPGILQSFNPATMTAVVQPAIMYQVRDEAGIWHNVRCPLLVDCPVHFPSGGGFTLTFPLDAGDEVLVHIAERCIDAWFASGGVQPQAEFRMHNLSDGFVVPKVWSKPNVIPNISTAAAQLRSDDGQTFVEVGTRHIILSPDNGTSYFELTPRGGGGFVARVQVAEIKLHATTKYGWDCNGYGYDVTYVGGNTWQVNNYTTPALGQTVNTTNNNISPPETP